MVVRVIVAVGTSSLMWMPPPFVPARLSGIDAARADRLPVIELSVTVRLGLVSMNIPPPSANCP